MNSNLPTSFNGDAVAVLETYCIGAFERPSLKVEKIFDKGNDPVALIKRASTLAFDHACTGPTDEHREAGAHYFVQKEGGEKVFSIIVTREGTNLLSVIANKLLENHRELMREWADKVTNQNRKYCQTSDIVLSGDINHIVEKIICPQLEFGSYVFDGSRDSWEPFLEEFLKPNKIETGHPETLESTLP